MIILYSARTSCGELKTSLYCQSNRPSYSLQHNCSSCPTGTRLTFNVSESGVNDKAEGTRQIALQAVVVIRYSGHGTTRCCVLLRGKSNTCFVLPRIPAPLTFITPLLPSRKSQCRTCKETSHSETHLCSQTLPASSFSITINRSTDIMGAWGYCK